MVECILANALSWALVSWRKQLMASAQFCKLNKHYYYPCHLWHEYDEMQWVTAHHTYFARTVSTWERKALKIKLFSNKKHEEKYHFWIQIWYFSSLKLKWMLCFLLHRFFRTILLATFINYMRKTVIYFYSKMKSIFYPFIFIIEELGRLNRKCLSSTLWK